MIPEAEPPWQLGEDPSAAWPVAGRVTFEAASLIHLGSVRLKLSGCWKGVV